jgi:hypothetical protein
MNSKFSATDIAFCHPLNNFCTIYGNSDKQKAAYPIILQRGKI